MVDNLPAAPGVEQSKITNALAMELAAKLAPVKEIMERYGLNKKQLTAILKDDEFKIIYAQAQLRWGADVNTAERVISKSTLMVEDSLLAIYGILHDDNSSATHRLNAFNALVDLSDAAPKKQALKVPEQGEKFSITINLSGGKQEFEIDNTKVIEGEKIDGT